MVYISHSWELITSTHYSVFTSYVRDDDVWMIFSGEGNRDGSTRRTTVYSLTSSLYDLRPLTAILYS